MSIEYNRAPTTLEVWQAFRKSIHENLNAWGVFESCTDIQEHGASYILTVWGLKDSCVPMIGAETRYFSDWGVKDEESVEHNYFVFSVKEAE